MTGVRFPLLAPKTKDDRLVIFCFPETRVGNRTAEGVGEPRLVPRVGKY